MNRGEKNAIFYYHITAKMGNWHQVRNATSSTRCDVSQNNKRSLVGFLMIKKGTKFGRPLFPSVLNRSRI